MEKKSFSKGMEDISSAFLSTAKKTEGRYLDSGFSAVPKRKETCESCANMIEGSSGKTKCRIFTFENEKYGVTHLDTITVNHAHYCHFFTSISSGKSGTLKEVKEEVPTPEKDDPEVEETITAQKKIVYSDTASAQKRMTKTILRYVESGFSIKYVELGKTTEIADTRKKKIREDKIPFSTRPSEQS